MPNQVVFTKPNGTEIEVSDTPENRALAASLGWKEKPQRKTKAD